MYSIDQLRIFTEPQQGATYDDLLAVAQRAEQLGFGAFFRSDHYLAMGGVAGGRRAARADRRVDDARRPRPRDVDDPPRHARHVGDVPAARTAGDHRRRRRPDVGRPRRARARRRLVRAGAPGVRHPVPAARRALRPARGAARGDHRPVVDAGRRDVRLRRRPLPRRRRRRRCPSRCRPAASRSSSAVAARSGRRRWRRASPPSTTRRSCSPDRFVEQRARVAAACAAIDRDPASLTYSAAAVVCLGADEAEVARRAGVIGREPDELRTNGVAGTPDEVRATLQRWADAGAERLYLQVLDLADLDHLDAIAALVALTSRRPAAARATRASWANVATWRAVGVEDVAEREAATAGEREARHVVEVPLVDARRAVEPHAVVEAGDEAVLGARRSSARRGWARTTASHGRSSDRYASQHAVQQVVAGERHARPASRRSSGRRRPARGGVSASGTKRRSEVGRPRRLLEVVGRGHVRHHGRLDDGRLLGALVRRLEVEDRPDGLAGDDATGGEAAPVADPIDLVADRLGGIAATDEVRRAASATTWSSSIVRRRRAQRLGDDLAAVEPAPRITGAGADVGVCTMWHEIEHARESMKRTRENRRILRCPCRRSEDPKAR